MQFEGAWTALVTPISSDGGVDWSAFEKIIEFQLSQGISGLVPAGTTGESPTLTWEEHNKVIDVALRLAKGKCGVLAGTGSNSTSETLESTSHAVENGAEAVLLVDCYYNGPSSLELRKEYYGRIAEKFPSVSVVPYVIPGRSGTALIPEDLAILNSDYPNVCAVKEATGDLDRMKKTRELLGTAFSIMSGDDDITYTMMSDPDIAANGVISVVTNVAPAAVEKMTRLALSGDLAGAEKLKKALSPLFGIVTVKSDNERILPNGTKVTVNDRFRNPLGIKTLMAALGMPVGICRQPLGKLTKSAADIVRNAAKQVWTNNPEILSPVGDFFKVDIDSRLSDDDLWSSLTY